MKLYSFRILLLLLFFSFLGAKTWAQTITITNFDPGPYSPGSSVAIPFHINDSGGCVDQNNTFDLYLSNSAGVYSGAPLTSISGFYATYINATIPALPTGAGYKFKIVSTATGAFAESPAFTIVAGTAITAAMTSSSEIDNTLHIFGNCNNTISNFTFTDASTNATSITTSFINESTQINDLTATSSPGGTAIFNPAKTNYTIIIKAGNGVVNGTKAYTLINNPKNSNFGFSGTQSVCLGGVLTFNIDYTGNDGIQFNYPGNTYKFDWGDGSSDILTFCQIKARGGHIAHTYTTSSCGSVVGTTRNVFKISFEPDDPYCGSFNAVSTTAKISAPPTNSISGPSSACTGVPVSFANTSYPGEDPNSAEGACIDFAGAKYTWYVDGVAQAGFIGVAKSTAFNPSLTRGNHIIKLSLDNNQSSCSVADATFNVCVQDKPVPAFTLSSNLVCSTGVVITNTSTFDNTCAVPLYNWTLKNAGTNAVVATSTDFEPNFVFPAAGTYTIGLAMPDACGNSIPSTTATVKVDSAPQVTFANTSTAYCGAQTLRYNNTTSATTQKITYAGTADVTTANYLWEITPLGGAAAASFAGTTSATSANPQIKFPGVGSYTVKVTQTNACGTATATQTIIIQQAPNIDVGSDATICAGQTYSLNGSISDPGSVQTTTWTTDGQGQFSDIHALNPVYTPLGTDLNGTSPVHLTLTVTTTLVGQCRTISALMALTIVPTDRITSVAAQSVCSGNSPNYQINASNPGSTFTWTATGSANAGAFTTSGNTNLINDILTTTNNINATVTYHIIPTGSNNCTGTPFDYTVTVNPLPVASLPANVSLCSGGAVSSVVNLAGASNLPNTKYTWSASVTSAHPGNVNGYSQKTSPSATISDVLNNTGTTAETVTYIFTPIAGSCPGASVTVNITVAPKTTQAIADPSATEDICNQTTFQLSGNTPLVGTGKWTESANLPVSFDDDTNPTANVSSLVPGTTYHFVWTITSSCGSTTNTVTVTDNALPVGGTTSVPNNPICSGGSETITLTGQTGNVTGWEQSPDGVVFTAISGTPTANTYAFSNLTQTTTFRAVVINGACTTPAYSQPVTVTVNPPTPQAAIPGGSQVLCAQANATLNGNLPNGTTGKWTLTSNQAGVTFDDDTKPNVVISGLVNGQTYIFVWTLTGSASCPTTAASVTITDLAPIGTNSILSPADGSLVCAGSDITLTASTPTGGSNSYAYQWQSSTDNGANWAVIANQTAKNATVTIGTQNTSYRRMVSSGACSDVSAPITIDIEAAIANNSLPISSEICYNTIPAEIDGSQPTGGDNVSYSYQWQQSNNATTGYTDIQGANGINYIPTQPLTVTTYFRRIVGSSVCSGATSNASLPVKVIVDPAIKADFSAQITSGCAPFNLNQLINGTNNITVAGDPNIKTYTWYADNNIINSSSNPTFPGYSLSTDGQSVTIKLTVTNALGCEDSKSITFNTINKVTAGFTMADTSPNPSGAQTYQFTNTSVPANAATYQWDFGDGATATAATPPNHVFAADETNGNDKVYTVKLTATTNCSVNSASQQITVYPSTPHALIDPGILTGCAPYTITARNLSPGTNASYDFYLYDGNALVQQITKTDKSAVSFNALSPTTTKTYTLYMVATNLYGVTGQSNIYPITVTPSGISANMTVFGSANDAVGCAPFNVTFQNLSNGGSSYVYNIYDSNQAPINQVNTNSTADQHYEFNTPGTYYVDLSVISSCTTAQSPGKIKIVVNPQPAPDFSTNTSADCSQTIVNFINNTPDAPNAPAASYSYLWDFGDGVTSAEFNPSHTYDYTHSPYTVKLTATNNYGCSLTTTKAAYIVVNAPPGTGFAVRPDTTISIPNYGFSFDDESANAVSWNWDFGDHTTSTNRNPTHTYADTGAYKVTLTAVSPAGCSDSKTRTVHITGVPGQLYVPNAFMPTSLNTELRVFTVKGSGIKQWDMRVYNSWGELIFETTKLNGKGEPTEFWDGRYKGQEVQQGGYAWEISATFINGAGWRGMSYKGSAPKKAGIVTLIR